MSSIQLRAGILFLMLSLLVSACAPKKVIVTEKPPQKQPVVRPTVPVKPDLGDDLFTDAEQLYQNKQIDAALEAYQTYLKQYPAGSWVPDSLLRTGQILLEQGKPAQALRPLQRLSLEYPKSSLSADADLLALQIYFQMNNFTGVIQRAEELLARPLKPETALKIRGILGEALISTGKTRDAMQVWDQAMDQADDEGRNVILKKMEKAAEQMPADALIGFSNQVHNSQLQGEMVYLAALQKADHENYDHAAAILDAFIDRFPQHARLSDVQQIADRIQQQSLFSRQTIGCLLPLTGQYEAYGKKALRGLEMAQFLFSQSNAGPPVTVLVRDTASSPEKAAELVMELARENKVAAIIGPVGSAESAAQAAQENQIPIITLTQKENISRIGNYVFQHYITLEMQAETLVSYSVKTLGLTRFGVLYPKDNYGTSFMNIFWDRVLAHGGKIVGAEGYDPGATDFEEPIQKLSGAYYSSPNRDIPSQPLTDATIQALFIPDSPVKAAMIIPQIAYHDLNRIFILGPNMWHTSNLFQASASLANGLFFADGFFAESSRGNVQSFVNQFRDTYDESPGFLEAITYDSAMMLFSVIADPNLKYRSNIRNALLDMPGMDGLTGFTRFSPERDAQKNLILLQIREGQFIETAIQ